MQFGWCSMNTVHSLSTAAVCVAKMVELENSKYSVIHPCLLLEHQPIKLKAKEMMLSLAIQLTWCSFTLYWRPWRHCCCVCGKNGKDFAIFADGKMTICWIASCHLQFSWHGVQCSFTLYWCPWRHCCCVCGKNGKQCINWHPAASPNCTNFQKKSCQHWATGWDIKVTFDWHPSSSEMRSDFENKKQSWGDVSVPEW